MTTISWCYRDSAPGHSFCVYERHGGSGQDCKQSCQMPRRMRMAGAVWWKRSDAQRFLPEWVSPASSRRWKYREEVENLGRVVAVVIRLAEWIKPVDEVHGTGRCGTAERGTRGSATGNGNRATRVDQPVPGLRAQRSILGQVVDAVMAKPRAYDGQDARVVGITVKCAVPGRRSVNTTISLF
jgi:hypothetical protein